MLFSEDGRRQWKESLSIRKKQPLILFQRNIGKMLREYLCEMTERKKTGCLGDGCHRQLGMLYQLLLGIGDAQIDKPFAERHVINGFDIRREVGSVGCQRGC